MQLESPAFADQEMLPTDHTCDGEGISPPLAWSEVPDQIESFVVLCSDPDAPGGKFDHWAIYDLDADLRSLPAGAGSNQEAYKQGINDFGRPGYGAACPPEGDDPHRYQFRILALELRHLDASGQPSYREVERAVEEYMLAEATLTGLYRR